MKLNRKDGKALVDWYKKNQRDFPWRKDKNPYRVWVSEIMLQQTRIPVVLERYPRFMERFPDVYSLANTSQDVLNKEWQGMGYYRRVRNMQNLAKEIVKNHDGKFPNTVEEWKKLPGIGEYTSSAIGAIVYDLPIVAIDGNVLRVTSRLFGDSRNVEENKVKKEIQEFWNQYILENVDLSSGLFTQGLMELGEVLCLPKGEPLCEKCPFQKICVAHQKGNPLDYPVRIKKKQKKVEHKTILILSDGKKIYLHKRSEEGLLAGLYEFYELEGWKSKNEILNHFEKKGFEVEEITSLESYRHVFSHRIWEMKAYWLKVKKIITLEGEWIKKEKVKDFAIPNAYKPYRNMVTMEEKK